MNLDLLKKNLSDILINLENCKLFVDTHWLPTDSPLIKDSEIILDVWKKANECLVEITTHEKEFIENLGQNWFDRARRNAAAAKETNSG